MPRLTILLVALITVALLPGCLDSSHNAHNHSHSGHAEQTAMTLNNGLKWETDEELRRAMGSIRDLVSTYRGGDGEAAKLATGIHSNIEYIFKYCTLEPAADATLHVIIGDIVEGAAQLEQGSGSDGIEEGIDRVTHGLRLYGQYFSHPGWDEHAGH